ncbi:MAG: DUF861 domain-containing protein [Phycisphaerae bacterium]|nr:cupin domain-containing protein [Gammaproteobacteria bacterium]NIR70698.1 cupin domain-containing protein [candidate division KSB1 bacterium]NIV01578.1 DUF861 domain-containing protein [Phycisphaerae bacterium]
MTTKIIDFKNDVTSISPAFPADRVLGGSPEQTMFNQFQDPSEQMLSGIWDCTEGKWQADYSAKSEFCHILSGKVVLTDKDGTASTFAAGDSFVIPMGFEGTWEVVEPVRKLYAIVTPQQHQ